MQHSADGLDGGNAAMQGYHPGTLADSQQQLLLRMADYTKQTVELTRQELQMVVMGQSRLLEEQALAHKKLETAMAEMQREHTSAMLTFEQRHWAALLGNEQRLTAKIEQGNVQVVAALALKLDQIQGRHNEEMAAMRQMSSMASNAHYPEAVAALGQPASARTGASGRGAHPAVEDAEVDALLAEIKTSVSGELDTLLAQKLAKRAGADKAAEAHGDEVLGSPASEALRELQGAEVESEQGSTAGTGHPQQQKPAAKRSSGRGSGKDDVKSSLPDEVVEEVEALQEEETNEILQVFKDNCSTSSGNDSSNKPQKATVRGPDAARKAAAKGKDSTPEGQTTSARKPPAKDGVTDGSASQAADGRDGPQRGESGSPRMRHDASELRRRRSSGESSRDSPRSSTPPQQMTDQLAAVSDDSEGDEQQLQQTGAGSDAGPPPDIAALKIKD